MSNPIFLSMLDPSEMSPHVYITATVLLFACTQCVKSLLHAEDWYPVLMQNVKECTKRLFVYEEDLLNCLLKGVPPPAYK